MLAHQGDWIRVGQLMVRDGNYRGAEVIRPGWVTFMRTPARSDSDYGAYLRVGSRVAGGTPRASGPPWVPANPRAPVSW